MLSELTQIDNDKPCWHSNTSYTKAELIETRNEMVFIRGCEMDTIQQRKEISIGQEENIQETSFIAQ